jgi:hypothetical protein
MMTGRPRLQRTVLRIIAAASLLALPGVFAPRLMAEKLSWIMGFGQPPMIPLMLYMMAGGAAVFVGQAMLLWALSTDVVRYQPLVRLMAWCYVVIGSLFLWIDKQAGLPSWWIMMDGVGSFAAGAVLLWACYARSRKSGV